MQAALTGKIKPCEPIPPLGLSSLFSTLHSLNLLWAVCKYIVALLDPDSSTFGRGSLRAVTKLQTARGFHAWQLRSTRLLSSQKLEKRTVKLFGICRGIFGFKRVNSVVPEFESQSPPPSGVWGRLKARAKNPHIATKTIYKADSLMRKSPLVDKVRITNTLICPSGLRT
jgi:hypothetical protein